MSGRRIYEGLPLPGSCVPPARPGTVLEVDGVSRRFGGIQAVSNASLRIDAGQIHALIGPNGAGKTTLFNLVSGLFRPDQGAVRLNGEPIHDLPSHRICQRGLARSFQITNLFRGLSIYENLRLSLQAQHPARFNAWRDIDSYPEVHAETAELIRFLGLEGIEEIEGGELSYGGQRLVDLGIALGSKPQVLLLDEPLGGARGGRARARVEPHQGRGRQHPGADRRARHRSRARLLAARHRDEPGRSADDRHARRGARRPARAGSLHRHRHAARHRPR